MIANQIWKSRVIYFQCDADLKRKSFVFYRLYCEWCLSELHLNILWSSSLDGDNPQLAQSSSEELSKPMYQSVIKTEGSAMVAMGAGLRSAAEASALGEDYVSPPKYKSSLLHRYLNDSLRHVMVANAVMEARKRNHSGSFSSNEYDDELLSPSSSEAEANFVYRAGKRPPCLTQLLIPTLNILHSGSFFSLPFCSLCLNSRIWSIIFNHLVWFLSLSLSVTLSLPHSVP